MSAEQQPRIYLSPPDIGKQEQLFVQEAFDTNWIAPLGPNVNAFEEEFCDAVGAPHAAALCSGTAGLHLAMILSGIQPGDTVMVSTLTFIASVNPILYCGAKPIFIDSEEDSWNLDPKLLEEALEKLSKENALPKALVLVHLYGQSADIDPIMELCAHYNITVIEDAAEALGATYKERSPGTFGRFGIYSFNGNKIITTSGGGMLVGKTQEDIEQARKLATQARDNAPHYQHSEVGFNYRLSNICAGVGRGQLMSLEDKVNKRRQNFDNYVNALGDLPGVTFAPEASWGRHTRWLTCLTIDPTQANTDRETIREHLTALNIEARPVWKPMHMQPLFEGVPCFGGKVSEKLFEQGICLPSGSSLTEEEQSRVIEGIKDCFK